jgi:uncharacterized protein
MKSSHYNFFFKARDGRYLLLNAFRRSRLFVDDELKEIIEKGVYDDVDPQIVQQLLAQGVATEGDEVGLFKELYKKRVYSPFEYEFTIIPTYQCNLTCYYCERSAKKMSHTMLQDLKTFFSAELEKGDFQNVAVRIAGGEPLLYPELLFDIMGDLSDIAQEHGKKFFSAVATNGTLLTPAMVDRLSHVNAMQVTFEGCRSYHDTIRYDKTGTFDRVLNSAEMIRDAGILLNMRVHVSEENINGLEELFDELHSSVGIGVESKTIVTVAPVVPTKMCPFYPSRCTDTVEAADVLPRAWEAARKSGIVIAGMPHPPTEMLPCPYTTPTSVIVGPDGILYKCLMAAQGSVFPVGSVSEGVMSSEPFSGPDTLWQDECTQCQLLVLCGSGCAWRRKVQTETACEGTRRLLTELVKFYVKNEHPILEG